MSSHSNNYKTPDHSAHTPGDEAHPTHAASSPDSVTTHPAVPAKLPRRFRLPAAPHTASPPPAGSSRTTPALSSASASGSSSSSSSSSLLRSPYTSPASSPLQTRRHMRRHRHQPYPNVPSPVSPCAHSRRHSAPTCAAPEPSQPRGSGPTDNALDSRPPPPTLPLSTLSDSAGAPDAPPTAAGNGAPAGDGDDGGHHDAEDADPEHSDAGLDYDGLGPDYASAWNLPPLESAGAPLRKRQADLALAFDTILTYFRAQHCPPCAVRSLPHTHNLDHCDQNIGCSYTDPAYALWHNKAFELPKGWCTYCLIALVPPPFFSPPFRTNPRPQPSAGGWHSPAFGRFCPSRQILKPALWALLTHPEPAPHLSTSGLIPAHLFLDPTPGLYALCDWLQTPIQAHNGLLHMHLILLWIFDRLGVHPIAESLRPLVTELAVRARDARPAPPL
ncbi:hypothetical protein B0H15DRAFT_803268 [Mycena belliarum]|uniref:Uncharacterized protein n=1 Tax=Mycena belliarum TaxID=1033014 RepID=A0AAD6TX05_9AGAR|nr:hypothetical protein B0H15DRAFT_803268 [Mycena belliae]